MADLTAIKYSVGPAGTAVASEPVFNDLAEARQQPLHSRTGLLRAIEFIRYIGRPGASTSLQLAIQSRAHLEDTWDRTVVAALLEPAGATLTVDGYAVSPRVDDDSELDEALRIFGQLSIDVTEGAHDASSNYLHNQLGLTGAEAAWALNHRFGEGLFTAKRVLTRAAKRTALPIDMLLAVPDTVWESTKLDVDRFAYDDQLLGVFLLLDISLIGRAPSPAIRYVLEKYPTLRGPRTLPASWPKADVTPTQKARIDAAIAVIAETTTFRASRRLHLPTDRTAAAKRALELRNKEGRTVDGIAKMLNDEGYRAARGGRWHRQSVAHLISTQEAGELK